MGNYKKNNFAIKIVLFLFSPVLSFLVSLKNIKSNSSQFIFISLAILFGLCFTPIDGKMDSSYYLDYFEVNKTMTTSQYFNTWLLYIGYESGLKDFYFHSLVYFTSRITLNYHFMFGMAASIFSYFAIKSFRFFTREALFVQTTIVLLLVLLVVQSNPIFNINGIRFWTASWVTVFSIFKIFIDHKKKFIFLLLLTPLIHASFWISFLIALLALLTRKNYKIWIILFYGSLITSNILHTFIGDISEYLPQTLQRYTNVYATDIILNKKQMIIERASFHVSFFRLLTGWYISIMLIIFIKEKKIILLNKKSKELFLFFIIWMVFVNLALNIPSIGTRFLKVGVPFAAYIWFVNYKELTKYNWLIYLMPFVYLLDMGTLLYRVYLITDPYFYISNIFSTIYKIFF